MHATAVCIAQLGPKLLNCKGKAPFHVHQPDNAEDSGMSTSSSMSASTVKNRDLSIGDLFRLGQSPVIVWRDIVASVSSVLDMALIAFATFVGTTVASASITSGNFYTGHVGALIGTYLVVGFLVLVLSGALSTAFAWSRAATPKARFLTKASFWAALVVYLSVLIFVVIHVRIALG